MTIMMISMMMRRRTKVLLRLVMMMLFIAGKLPPQIVAFLHLNAFALASRYACYETKRFVSL